MRKIAILAGVACLGTAAFAYGPLLPWSPVKPGYGAARYSRAAIYFDRAEPLLQDFREVDRMMNEAEAFHALRFRRAVQVIACKSWGDCRRALPWLNTLALGGVTLATGDVIYITPKLRETPRYLPRTG